MRDLFILLRLTLGISLLCLGVIGLILPVLQGWILILVAIPLISPKHGKLMVEKLRFWKEKISQRFKKKDF
ncbi:hypothetical protein HZA42_04050 [Candidatus Peregrinibacteria bacterium]|nr:hypothetical protein [Candidatus Peregrinibacteria bacterium]